MSYIERSRTSVLSPPFTRIIPVIREGLRVDRAIIHKESALYVAYDSYLVHR